MLNTSFDFLIFQFKTKNIQGRKRQEVRHSVTVITVMGRQQKQNWKKHSFENEYYPSSGEGREVALC